jgi:NAD(P)-dependent dehydrogenase (short-subunit alcohol dehydrogenase family)
MIVARRRDFAGKVVVITGAGGGLGAAYSRRFLRANSLGFRRGSRAVPV